MKRVKIFVQTGLLALLALVAGVAQAQSMTLQKGVLLAGSDTSFPPFEARAINGGGVDGYTGFDVDLVNAVAKDMGLKFKVQSMNFDGLIPAVQGHRIDMIMSAMTITKERAKNVAFTCPYIDADLSILSRTKDGPLTTKDLKGKIIGGEIGTTGLAKAKSIPGTKAVKTYETTLDAINDLMSGRIYAVVNDQPVNAYVAHQHPELTTGEIFHSGAQYGYAFNKHNTALLNKFNAAMAKVKADGTYAKIYEKWFGKKPATIPGCKK